MRWAPALALVVGLAVSVWVGWTRHALLEPAPIAVLTASAPATVHGARFGLVGISTLPAGADSPPGSVTVRLDLTKAGGAADLACVGWLVAGPDSWRNRYDEASSCQGQPGEDQPGQDRPGQDQPGKERRLSFYWEVPAGTQPSEFQLRFGTERLAIRP